MTKRIKSAQVKGFTLVEVIVAMAILGIMSLLMVGMYGSVCKHIKNNNDFNDRMSEQQKFVEQTHKGIDTSVGGTALYEVIADSTLIAGSNDETYNNAQDGGSVMLEIKCVKNSRNTAWEGTKTFKTRCAMYVIKNLEDGEPVPGSDTDDMQVDFKYFVGDNG
ncbi:MAG: type II secretion system protein J [Huintestinicola sp.]